MRNKIISVEEAVNMIPDGATIMYGGFLGCGSAHHIIEGLAKKGTKGPDHHRQRLRHGYRPQR